MHSLTLQTAQPHTAQGVQSLIPEALRLLTHIQAHNAILVAAHGNPDGDAMGATCAMGWLLTAMGKKVALYNGTGVPEYLDWLSFPGPVHTRLATLPFNPELVLALDCGDAWRLGKELAEALPGFDSINIDHHLGNPLFGSVDNWIDPNMAATGQMVAALADAAGVPLQGELACGVYLSLVSDTGSFSHGNTSASVLHLAARLVEGGLDAADLRAKLDNQWTLEKTRLWGQLMRKVQLENTNRVALCTVTLEQIASCGANKDDLEGFVEQMRRIKGVRVALLVREDATRRCKISLRSMGNDNVNAVAALFEGGGHKNAAGATLDLKLPEAVQQVLEALNEHVFF